MPHSVAIEDGVVVGRFRGEVTIDELRRSKQEIQQLPGFRAEFPHIIDLTDAGIQNVSFASVAELMREDSITSPLAVQVIVVSSESAFNVAKKIQQLAPSTGRAVLLARSFAEAHATLDILARQEKP